MPENEVVDRAKEDLKEGKSPSTAAGEFVHEEIEHVREGKHGARSPQQAIAIGLSKARRAGIPLAPPKAGTTSISGLVDLFALIPLDKQLLRPGFAKPGCG